MADNSHLPDDAVRVLQQICRAIFVIIRKQFPPTQARILIRYDKEHVISVGINRPGSRRLYHDPEDAEHAPNPDIANVLQQHSAFFVALMERIQQVRGNRYNSYYIAVSEREIIICKSDIGTLGINRIAIFAPVAMLPIE